MTVTTETTLLPVDFVPPLLNPAPGGLVNAVGWTDQSDAPRWLAEGVEFRGSVTGNYSGDLSTGIWSVPWCASPDDLGPDDLKTGVRPGDPEPFLAVTAWGFDSCDMTEPSQAEIIARAQQVLRMREPVRLAREFAGRAKIDAPTPITASDLIDAIGELEAAFAGANTIGVIHGSAKLLPALVKDNLAARSGTGFRTPAGHLLVVDGGYRPVLGDDLLIGTSALYGWRNAVEVRTSVQPEAGVFVALAERSSVIGYEALVAAVKVAP